MPRRLVLMSVYQSNDFQFKAAVSGHSLVVAFRKQLLAKCGKEKLTTQRRTTKAVSALAAPPSSRKGVCERDWPA